MYIEITWLHRALFSLSFVLYLLVFLHLWGKYAWFQDFWKSLLKLITLRKQIVEGEFCPLPYGIVMIDLMSGTAVAYPVPLNLIIRFVRWFWYKITYFRPGGWELALAQKFEEGRTSVESEIIEANQSHMAFVILPSNPTEHPL
jgi:hypothetical protein